MVPFCGLPGQSAARGAGARHDQHRHGAYDLLPAPPAWELNEIIRPHQPDEARTGEAALQFAQGVARVARAKPRLDIRGDDSSPIGNPPGTCQALSLCAHPGGGFQRVAGRDHEPELVQPQMPHGLLGDVQMPFMRRVERAAEQADLQPVAMASQRLTWPVPRTT